MPISTQRTSNSDNNGAAYRTGLNVYDPYRRGSVGLLSANVKPNMMTESERAAKIVGEYLSYLAISLRIAPYNPDQLIASKGYDILDNSYTMACVRGPLDIIREAIMYKDWSINVPKNISDSDRVESQEYANALRYAFDNIDDRQGNAQDFRDVIWELSYAIHTGFNVTEIIWKEYDKGQYAGKWGFEFFSSKPCRQIGFDLDWDTFQVRNITSYVPMEGYKFDIPVEKCLRYTFAPIGSMPFGNGIGRTVYKHYWTIDSLMKFRNLALETFGSPFLMIETPPNNMEQAREVIAQVRQGSPPAIPNNMKATLMQVVSGGLDAFDKAIATERQQCTFAYLHNTLTTGTGPDGGAKALGSVHEDTQEYMFGRTRKSVEAIFNRQLIPRFIRYNYGEEAMRCAPEFSLGAWDETDVGRLANALDKMIKDGTIHQNEPFVRERLGFPPPSPEIRKLLDKQASEMIAGQLKPPDPVEPKEPKKITAKKGSFSGMSRGDLTDLMVECVKEFGGAPRIVFDEIEKQIKAIDAKEFEDS